MALVTAGAVRAPLAAQEADDLLDPRWMRAWQPLRPLAEPRAPAPYPAPPGAMLLLAPEPRVGLFWTAGNPAGLPGDVDASWTRFSASRQEVDGEHRRPLDPIREETDRIRGMSHGPVGDWGAAAGEVSFRRTMLAPNSFADVLDPYRGTPFILTDTSRVDFRRMVARLEGAVGVRLGAWTVGVGGGHASIDNRTRESGFARFGRGAVWAATLGLARDLGNDVRAGLHARYRGEAETMAISAQEDPGRVHLLEGWSEPTPLEFAEGTGSLFRRMERRGIAVGAQLAGPVAGGEWVLWGEHGDAEETQINTTQAEEDDPFDRWDTEDLRFGLEFQRSTGPFLLEAGVSWSETTGEARQPDFNEPIFLGSRSELATRAGSRWMSDGGTWRARLEAGAAREHHERTDRIVNLRSDLSWWRVWGSGGVARALGRWEIELGYGFAFRDPSGSIPEPAEFGAVAQSLVGRGLDFDATSATAHRFDVGTRWATGARTAVWLGAGYLRVVPTAPDTGIGQQSDGARDRWLLAAGVIIADR